MKNKPFHTVRHHGAGKETRWSVMLNNRQLLKYNIPLSRDIAVALAALLNKSPRALIAAKHYPLRETQRTR